ncbi:MAG: glycosyltransferase [Fidelibacterota bacterium]
MGPERTLAVNMFGLTLDQPVLSIIGGSQGSRALNTAVERALQPLFSAVSVQIIWQTGFESYPELKPLESRYPLLRIQPFIDHMGALYSASDLVVSRAGALALAEITRCGKPAILVPFPGAAAHHQTTNARMLEQAGAAVILKEKDLSTAGFVGLVTELLSNPERLKAMGKASKTLSVPGASERIAREILSLVTP